MMKKRMTVLALSILLAVLLAACGTQQTMPVETEPEQTAAAESGVQTAEGDVALPEAGLPEAQDTQDAQTASDDAPDAPDADDTSEGEADAQFGPLFIKYVRSLVKDGSYTISMRQSGITMVTTVSGEDSAIESNVSDVMYFTLINKGGKYYMVVHNSKKYTELTEADYSKQADSLQDAVLELENIQFTESGTETIDGKQYSTETYDEGVRGTVTYYFNDAGLARAKVVKNSMTSVVESLTVRDDADADMFKIPTDYKKTSDPVKLWAK